MPIKSKQQHNWSPYQKAIFEDIARGKGHTIVVARAGAAKTSSLIEGFKYLPKKAKALMVAFNKSIADELREKAASYVDTFTLHSLGFRAVRMAFGKTVYLDTHKAFKIVRNIIYGETENLEKESYARIFSFCRCISLCKGYLVDTPSKIDDIIDDFDVATGEYEREDFIKIVIRALRLCKEETKCVDYDDMVWLPVVYNIPLKKYDYVFIDECQDLNAAQIFMALNCCKKNTGRIIAVGDNFQGIYRFRGADSEALSSIQKKLNAKTLSLPISYRCASSIIKLAQEFVPDIQAAPHAKDGKISAIYANQLLSHAKPGDFVISRTNAPLVKYCMLALKAGVSANIAGKDIGANLSTLIKQSKKTNVDEFLIWLDDWKKTEVKRLGKKNRDISFVLDKVECLYNLCEGEKNISVVQENIDALFKDVSESGKIVFTTAHKSKGLERDRAFLLNWTFKDSNQEEKNIKYVALTRAKNELIFVSQ